MTRRRKTTSPPILIIGDTFAIEEQEVVVPFVLGKPWTVPITVPWHTADGTAQAGLDYEESGGVIVFAPGEVTKWAPIKLIGDARAEPIESFLLVFGPITPTYVLGNDARDTNSGSRAIIIVDDD